MSFVSLARRLHLHHRHTSHHTIHPFARIHISHSSLFVSPLFLLVHTSLTPASPSKKIRIYVSSVGLAHILISVSVFVHHFSSSLPLFTHPHAMFTHTIHSSHSIVSPPSLSLASSFSRLTHPSPHCLPVRFSRSRPPLPTLPALFSLLSYHLLLRSTLARRFAVAVALLA